MNLEYRKVESLTPTLVSTMNRSKDQSTKVGAIIFDIHQIIRCTGYNGMPRGMSDEDPLFNARPEKYYWYEHAERNAIYNAARVGVPLEGCAMIVSMPPCMDCARAIVQSGIKHVISADINLSVQPHWIDEHLPRVRVLFETCGVEFLRIDHATKALVPY